MSREWYDAVPKPKFPALSLLTLLLVVCTPILASTAYAASADLTVTNVWLETTANPGQAVSSVALGQQFNIVASIKNMGDAPASGYYLDVYYDSDYGRGGPDNIAAGEIQEWYVGPLTATAGTHTTHWVADPDNQIAETNENNNQLTFSFTIGSVNATTTTTTTSQSSTTSTSSSESTTSTSSSESTTSTSSSESTTAPTYSVVFYVDPSSGEISAEGAPVTNGTMILGYSQDQRVHIVASGLSGYQFATWEVSGVSVDTLSLPDTYMTVSSSGSVKAHFAPITYTVTFYTDPTSGTITVNGATETNGLTGTYASGARVRVVANPPSGYLFAGWTVSGVSVDNPSVSDTYMTVAGSGSLKASFASPQVTVKSKSVLGTLSGAKITVDSKSYSTPFSLTLSGSHKFTAPSKVTVAGVSYTFVRWEDESGTALSASAGFSYSIQSSKTFYAVYNPPQYSLTAYAYDARTRKALVGASVYLDGNLFGTTNSAGYLVLKGVYAGAHAVTIHKDGYVDYTTTIKLSGSTTLRAYLTRVS